MKMKTKSLAAAGVAVLALTGGGVAIASPTPAPTASQTTVAGAGHHGDKATKGHHARNELRRALHAQWVTRKGTAFVTHDAIRGQASAVSPTSITVKAKDGVSQTYSVTSATKVRVRKDGKGTAATTASIHVGDRVAVVGSGSNTISAVHIVFRAGAPKAASAQKPG